MVEGVFDPAVEAARTAFQDQWPDQDEFDFEHSTEGRFGVAAAREILKPIQEWHKARSRDYAEGCTGNALIMKRYLDELAPLIYGAEERVGATVSDDRAYHGTVAFHRHVNCECGHGTDVHEGDEYGFCLVCDCSHYRPVVRAMPDVTAGEQQ